MSGFRANWNQLEHERGGLSWSFAAIFAKDNDPALSAFEPSFDAVPARLGGHMGGMFCECPSAPHIPHEKYPCQNNGDIT